MKSVAMLEKLSSILDVCGEDKVLPQLTNNEIFQHLTALENDFNRYFSELNRETIQIVRLESS